jgi:hypothetical protein
LVSGLGWLGSWCPSTVFYNILFILFCKYCYRSSRCWCFMPVILATQEAGIRRIMIQSHCGQLLGETLFQKTHHKKGLMEWIKVYALSLNPSTTKKNYYMSIFLVDFFLLICNWMSQWTTTYDCRQKNHSVYVRVDNH